MGIGEFMNDKDNLLINSLSSHVQSNAECVERLMVIIGDSMPHTQEALIHLGNEWRRINKEINTELETDMESLNL